MRYPTWAFQQEFAFVSKVVVTLHDKKSEQTHENEEAIDGSRRAYRLEQATFALAGGGVIFHGIAGHDDFEYGRTGDFGSAEGDAAQHEVGAGELHAEPGGVHSD